MSTGEELDPEHLVLDAAEFRRWVIELPADHELRVDAPAWHDAIVFLTSGEIELECVSGRRRRFAREAILCLTTTVRLLRNSGAAPARLIAISRNESPKRTG